uniref:HDC04260 n=1 Tax=Drosophila melanogaster TaxID=7227 RepID=Q6IGY5_DROME|nr:TPA_inf: HDC04260 [Drosophila melanogaster]
MSGKCHLKNLKAPQTPQRKGWRRGVHLGLALAPFQSGRAQPGFGAHLAHSSNCPTVAETESAISAASLTALFANSTCHFLAFRVAELRRALNLNLVTAGGPHVSGFQWSGPLNLQLMCSTTNGAADSSIDIPKLHFRGPISPSWTLCAQDIVSCHQNGVKLCPMASELGHPQYGSLTCPARWPLRPRFGAENAHKMSPENGP